MNTTGVSVYIGKVRNKERRAVLAVSAMTGVFAVVLLFALTARSAHAATPENGDLAYTQEQGGSGVDVYRSDSDGSDPQSLTTDGASDGTSNRFPAWSPDGTKVAYQSDADGDREIYTMNADGSGNTNVTNDPADDINPDWSPDGARIVFVSDRSGTPAVYTMNADGTEVTHVIDDADQPFYPLWSPDGGSIIYSTCQASCTIYRVNVDGSGLDTLYTGAFATDWSADGAYLLVITEVGSNVYRIDADGTSPVQLTEDVLASRAEYSPDQAKIVYTATSGFGSFYQVFVMNADGSGSVQVSSGDVNHLEASWQPIFPDEAPDEGGEDTGNADAVGRRGPAYDVQAPALPETGPGAGAYAAALAGYAGYRRLRRKRFDITSRGRT